MLSSSLPALLIAGVGHLGRGEELQLLQSDDGVAGGRWRGQRYLHLQLLLHLLVLPLHLLVLLLDLLVLLLQLVLLLSHLLDLLALEREGLVERPC